MARVQRLEVSARTRHALIERARALRRQATPAERMLWQRLRGGQLGVRVRRQQPIGPFIVDFFVPAMRLVIEIDGRVHDGDAERARDAERQRQLEAVGLRVLRFRNAEVVFDVDAVVARVRAGLTSRSPLPVAGEGKIPADPRPPSPPRRSGGQGVRPASAAAAAGSGRSVR